MIYPTRAAILAAAAIAPAALLIGVLVPAYWYAGLALLFLLLVLAAIDALAGTGQGQADLVCEGPGTVGVGTSFDIDCAASFAGAPPRRFEVALEAGAQLAFAAGPARTAAVHGTRGSARIGLVALRRGSADIARAWLRWRGHLGLVWKQKIVPLAQPILVVPDIAPVTGKGAQMLHRDAMHGLVAQLALGEGAEFEALAEYRQGMDVRAIDWKSSARHNLLLAKEYRTERNNNIVLALDSGRTMCEPVAGVPRIDKAVSAALLTAYVALKTGDRVSLFAFDSHPRLAADPVSGVGAFARLQRQVAGIDYAAVESNHTLGVATLAAKLRRRSLVILFTDFADTTGAELMLAALGALLKRHLLLFVLIRDEELETIAGAEPLTSADVVRSVTAAALLRERALVVIRLKRLGVHVVEAPHDGVGPALVAAYVDLKRRNLL